jgi:hypothetical protein
MSTGSTGPRSVRSPGTTCSLVLGLKGRPRLRTLGMGTRPPGRPAPSPRLQVVHRRRPFKASLAVVGRRACCHGHRPVPTTTVARLLPAPSDDRNKSGTSDQSIQAPIVTPKPATPPRQIDGHALAAPTVHRASARLPRPRPKQAIDPALVGLPLAPESVISHLAGLLTEVTETHPAIRPRALSLVLLGCPNRMTGRRSDRGGQAEASSRHDPYRSEVGAREDVAPPRPRRTPPPRRFPPGTILPTSRP